MISLRFVSQLVESTTSVQTEISTSRSQVTTLASESTTEGVSTGVQQQQITTMQQLPGNVLLLSLFILVGCKKVYHTVYNSSFPLREYHDVREEGEAIVLGCLL